jgi:polar amino acid transport system substrate-binding protein
MSRATACLVAGILTALAVSVAGCATVGPAHAQSPVQAVALRDPAISPDAVTQLAPTGSLRIGVYPGSPTSFMPASGAGEPVGIAHDLGRALARRLGVPAQIVQFSRVAEIVEALQRGEVDFTFTNASAARARLIDFSQPLVRLELGLLVPAGSPVTGIDTLDRTGIRVGVTQGSSSLSTLGARLTQARIVQARSVSAARQMLSAGELDAFATNKAILFELADQVPGARVLEGRWGFEHLAIALPKGRPVGLQFVEAWVGRELPATELQAIITRSGLRGMARD